MNQPSHIGFGPGIYHDLDCLTRDRDREHLMMLRTPDSCACALCERLRERGLFPPAGSSEARLPHRISNNEARLLLLALKDDS